MVRLTHSLWVRMMSVVLIILAALAPLLYLGVSRIVEDGYQERFINSVRAYSRLVADQLEALDAAEFERRAGAVLDGVVLSGQVVFAQIVDGERKIHSSITPALGAASPREDYTFGQSPDQVYYISHQVRRPDHAVVLRLGFDEIPTSERIRATQRHVLLAIGGFVAVSIGLALWLSAVIARPMVLLQESAKRVASGDVHVQLQSHSSIREVAELNLHLERMRQELVGTNEQLTREIAEREASEHKRLTLERRLLHRERIVALGTLAGGVAHEINNIITPILLYAQMALDELPASSDLRADLQRVVESAHRARNLVWRILTFSRQSDTQAPSTVFALRAPVEDALALLRAIVPTNIEVVFRCEAEGVQLTGDPNFVQQVVFNLCTNAHQAMRRDGGRITVTLAAEEDPGEPQLRPGRYGVLEVSDTGEGIDPAALPHIFEPFFTTREVGEGTGLGLSVVHGIVESMGGLITVRSASKLGTTFRVYLPVAVALSNAAGAA
ncbi:MAG: HAMP domain-containing protein [Gammaproteobacteria bacterium]|nr:HAMP domain-containing protein [Gammaproteobacteria bacterium]